jgi:hypothetical protein
MKVTSSAHFSLCSVSGGFFLGLLFDSEYVGDMVLQNVRLPLNYTIFQPRRHTVSLLLQGETRIQQGTTVYHIFIVASPVRCPVTLGHFQEQIYLGNPEIQQFVCCQADKTEGCLSTAVQQFLTLINSIL